MSKDIDRKTFTDELRKQLNTVPSDVLPQPVSFTKPTEGIDAPVIPFGKVIDGQLVNDNRAKQKAEKAFVLDKAAQRRD
jgi:hypothetical protein